MITNRLNSQSIDKSQTVKQQPTKVVQGKPSNVDLAGLNTGNFIVDEANGIVYFKGTKKVIKVTGVVV